MPLIEVSCAVQDAPTSLAATAVHALTAAAGNDAQQVARAAHSAAPLVPVPLPPVVGELELLQAAAVMEAAKTTGMAKRYRLAFMAGHHTRGTDQVKKDHAVGVTKAYIEGQCVSMRPAGRERYRLPGLERMDREHENERKALTDRPSLVVRPPLQGSLEHVGGQSRLPKNGSHGPLLKLAVERHDRDASVEMLHFAVAPLRASAKETQAFERSADALTRERREHAVRAELRSAE